jgi:uncharacterized protein YraI
MSGTPRIVAAGLLVLALLLSNVPILGAIGLAAPGELAVVATTGGETLKLRAGPGTGYAILLGMVAGTEVEILAGPVYDGGLAWYRVGTGGVVGWSAGEWLQSPTAGSGGGVLVGERAIIHGTEGQDVRIRDGIGVGAPIVGFVPEDDVVLVVNGPLFDGGGNAWYGIDYDGIQGWVFGDYLRRSSAALVERIGDTPYDPVLGEAIATEALTHLDVPYVWGGDGPQGWDCSGMVQWLYAVVGGIDLPRVSQDQFFAGTPLGRDEIRPGDIVFFADTDGPGITHNGIAIGGGRFIHARDEARGTMISALDEPRFVEHYAGARRP